MSLDMASTDGATYEAEATCIERIVARLPGWQECFRSLVDQYGPYLRQRCARYLDSAADVEDAVQETFISAYRFLARFEGRSSLKTWLTRIADNHCMQVLRRRQRYAEAMSFDDIKEAWEHRHAEEPVLADDDSQRIVSTLMAKLSPAARESLALRYWGELSFEEMASVFGVGVSASKMRVRRALVTAKEQLGENQCLDELLSGGWSNRSESCRLCA